MKLASKGQNQYWEEQRFRLFRMQKRILQRVRYHSGESKTVLLIAGCQRSGTSMIHHLFRKDSATVTYDEYSALSILRGEEPLRWRSADEVVPIILADRSPLVVTKPLVEAQNLRQWLDAFSESRSIWMFRDVRDVVASSLKYFGEDVGARDLAPIIAYDESNWRCERLSRDVVEMIREFASRKLTPADSAALFWYARNSLFFSEGLDSDRRVILCRYEELVSNPVRIMKQAYLHLGREFPGSKIVSDVSLKSIGNGRDVVLSNPIDQLCSQMMNRLLDAQGVS
jgi:hypothetical protein